MKSYKKTIAILLFTFLQFSLIGQWVKKSDAIQSGKGRGGSQSLVLNKKLYISGGYSGFTLGYNNNTIMYDPILNSWTPKASPAEANRTGGVSFVINGKAYMGLGAKNILGLSPAESLLLDMWEYDDSLNKWTAKAIFPDSGRTFSAVFVIENKAYIAGGNKTTKHKGTTDLWQFDPIENKWTKKANLPMALINASGFSNDQFGFVVAGMDTGRVGQNKLFKYDPRLDKWSKQADFPLKENQGGVSFVIKNNAYYGLGSNKNIGASNVLFPKTFYKYDMVSDLWEKTTFDWPADGRIWPVAQVIDNKVYAGCGYKYDNGTESQYKDLFELDLNSTIGPDISKCPGSRIINGCSINDIFNPAFSTTLSAVSVSVFSDNTNQGVASNFTEVKYQDSILSLKPLQILRNWIVLDGSNNSSNCQQSIRIMDSIPPIIQGWEDSTFYRCDVVVPEVKVSDNCSLKNFKQTEGPMKGSIFKTGTTRLAFEAEDESGNISQLQFMVTIINPLALSIDSIKYEPCYGKSAELILNASNVTSSVYQIYLNDKLYLTTKTPLQHKSIPILSTDSTVSIRDSFQCAIKQNFKLNYKDSIFKLNGVSLKNPTSCSSKNGEIILQISGPIFTSYWYDVKNNLRLPPNQTNTNFAAGTYLYIAFSKAESDSSSCRFEYGPYVLSCPSKTTSPELSSLVQFYPNPVSNDLNIYANGPIKYIAMYNVTGQVVLTKSINRDNYILDCSNLSDGIYYLKLEMEHGVQQFKFNVIK